MTRNETTTALPEEADRLYGLPLSEFVGKRNALVKQRRADGRLDDSAVVASLAKPASLDSTLRDEATSARLTNEHVYSGLGLLS